MDIDSRFLMVNSENEFLIWMDWDSGFLAVELKNVMLNLLPPLLSFFLFKVSTYKEKILIHLKDIIFFLYQSQHTTTVC